MNYYNPYFYSMPKAIASSTQKVGLLTRLFGKSGATLSTILSGTQKVLGVANQAIPLVKQVRPMVNNAKTMFKIMNEFKRNDTKSQTAKSQSQSNQAVTDINNEVRSSNNINNDNIVNKSNDLNSIEDNDNGLTFFV